MKDDTISRAAAIDAVNNMIRRKFGISADLGTGALLELPSATDTNVGGNLIDRQAAIAEIMEDLEDRSLHDDPATPEDYAEGYDEGIRNAAAIVLQMPSAQPVVISKSENTTECEDTVPRTSVEYICRKNTVSTNPYEHKYHDKFIQFMDDQEISDFGRWQHSNGFNTALVAVKCDLDKVPSVTPKQPGWIPVTERLPERYDNYLITTEDEDTDIGTFHPGFKQWSICDADGFMLTDGVLAWCELPKPWEGDVND